MVYSRYGAILSAEHLGASIESHIGHKGLFLDRLDVGVGDDASAESPRLVPFAHAMYQNRNRSYSPSHGRFMQLDPNQTAMALMSVTASHGRGFGAIQIAFSMEGMYGDGLNLYQYLGSNPWTNSDPLGLSHSDPFDEIDAIINEYVGARVAIIHALGQGPQAAAIVAATVASYLPIPGAAIVGDIALAILNGDTLSIEGILQSAALGIIPGGKLSRLISRKGGQLFASISSNSANYAGRGLSRGGGSTLAALGGGAARAAGGFLKWLNKGAKENTVYLGIRGGKAVYVGITKQPLKRRERQHDRNPLRRNFNRLEPVAFNLTRRQARAVEQVYIVANPHFENLRNSINPRSPHFNAALNWGTEHLARIGKTYVH